MMEAPVLRTQAAANTREPFNNSPNLSDELTNAIIDASTSHQNMSKPALNSETIMARLLSILVGPDGLWEGLRGEGTAGTPARPIPQGSPGLHGTIALPGPSAQGRTTSSLPFHLRLGV